MKKRNLLGVLMFGIFAFVMYVGGVSAAGISWTNPNSLPLLGGEYELNVDVEISNDNLPGWLVNDDTIIHLNGHHIIINNPNFTENSSYEDGKPAIGIQSNKSLSIIGNNGSNEYIASNNLFVFYAGSTNTLDLDGLTINAEYNAIQVGNNATVNIGNISVNQKDLTNPDIIMTGSATVNINSSNITKGYAASITEADTSIYYKYDLNKVPYAAKEGQTVNIDPKSILNTTKEIETVVIKSLNGEISYTEANGIYSFVMPSSTVTVVVKFKDDASSSTTSQNTNTSNSASTVQNNNQENKKTTNPKTSDIIVPALVVSALSLVGLNLLLLIKKRFN